MKKSLRLGKIEFSLEKIRVIDKIIYFITPPKEYGDVDRSVHLEVEFSTPEIPTGIMIITINYNMVVWKRIGNYIRYFKRRTCSCENFDIWEKKNWTEKEARRRKNLRERYLTDSVIEEVSQEDFLMILKRMISNVGVSKLMWAYPVMPDGKVKFIDELIENLEKA